ncbi:MAG: SGNH/GDSL hydrolase family protein, partial [Chloroflexota bacterium]|nr:SGNH/GDSL hydrolase family protein [Chloroflexota bacterium]
MTYRSRKKSLTFSLALVLGLLVIAEVGLQILAWSSRSIRTVLSVETIYAAAPDSRLVWRGNPEYPGHDELGFRNPRVPSEAAVVALGDSQTYGSKLSPDEAWPRQLERRGDLPTYNMAFPGWGPLQSFRALDDALALKPRLVVMALFAGNDLVDSFTFVYHRDRLEEFKSRDQTTLDAVDAAEDAEPWDSDGIADQNPITEPRRRPRPPESAAELVERYSRLYGLGNAVRRAYVYYQRHPFWQEPGATLDTSRNYL